MAEQIHLSPETFTAKVQRELAGLEPGERRGILEELVTHLEDAASALEEAGLPRDAAMQRALAEMGDPVLVGRRLREEHMALSLPLPDALLAGVPFLAVPMLLLVRRVTFPIGVRLPWIELVGILAVLAVVAGLCLWSLKRGQRVWLATLSGTVGILGVWFPAATLYGAISSLIRALLSSIPEEVLQPWLFNSFWVVLALVAFPAVTLLVRWGRSQASLAILGAVGTLVVFLGWDEGFVTWLKVVAYALPYLGLVMLVAVPRRYQAFAAWAVLLGDWVLYVLGIWYYRAYGAPEALRVINPARIEDFWNPAVLTVLFSGMVLLLWSQGVAVVGARRVRPAQD